MPRATSRCGLVFAALISLPAMAGEVSETRKAELSYLVRQDCGSCHGMTLKGGLGRSLLPEDLEAWNAESLTAVILDGIPGKPMPPWRNLISEGDARWIAEALKQGSIR